mmetsp:Transcript_44695/g.59327  ORF Transcript_44695/g.59327 Transcript_44695/m.59327 type:complete len:231 (+) Transcript_44695:1387-2079(+)
MMMMNTTMATKTMTKKIPIMVTSKTICTIMMTSTRIRIRSISNSFRAASTGIATQARLTSPMAARLRTISHLTQRPAMATTETTGTTSAEEKTCVLSSSTLITSMKSSPSLSIMSVSISLRTQTKASKRMTLATICAMHRTLNPEMATSKTTDTTSAGERRCALLSSTLTTSTKSSPSQCITSTTTSPTTMPRKTILTLRTTMSITRVSLALTTRQSMGSLATATTQAAA